MKVNEAIKCICRDLNHQGLGVCKVDGFPLFVADLLVGEEALVKITKLQKKFGYGEVITRLKESPDRVEPICPVFNQCGGCQLMHLSYLSQLDYKVKMAEETFKRIGHLDLKVKKIIGMDDPYYFRNKVQVPFREVDGEIEAGFFKKNTHDIVPLEVCFIQPKLATEITKTVKVLFKKYQLPAYNEEKHQGLLRHLLIRKTIKDDYMVVFITRSEAFLYKEEITRELIKKYPMVKSVIQNINPLKTNVILGDKSKLLYGSETLLDEMLGLKFHVSEKSFFQTNHLQTEALYREIERLVAPKPDEIIVDGYCGVGTISLLLARKAKKVYGIEIVQEAVNDAKVNANLNKINNVEFIAGRTETEIENFKALKIDTIVVDPPRKGCDKTLLETIIAKKIKKVVYVSCDVATLARDLEILAEAYEIKEITLVDMFPQTTGVEAVCSLNLK
ncbi:MAG TPA: 23S rRNA (uracil(1939)-C(5))-methyltransferase RlmD [Acholeplasmataceae bacterium]|nr:23S rRNA (uracil(1939)-C(5))-methyltransferase RlmD [Acholeplasmataceae bacterium]